MFSVFLKKQVLVKNAENEIQCWSIIIVKLNWCFDSLLAFGHVHVCEQATKLTLKVLVTTIDEQGHF